VYAAKLRSGDYIKIQVQTLESGVFTFRYADLDGANEKTKTISKADHAGKTLAYYSFADESTVDVEPADGFDFALLRYSTPLDDGTGGLLDYTVTGVLAGPGVEVAQADAVDPATVSHEDYVSELSTELDIIGHDWKSFDLGTFSWLIPEDLVYFVRTADAKMWKIQFVDFEGSSTGIATFIKTDLGTVSAIGDVDAPVETFEVYPNPARNVTHLVFSQKNTPKSEAIISIADALGRPVYQTTARTAEGLNSISVPLDNLSNGFYYLTLTIDNQRFSKKVSVVN
jgi:hypothetical protein